MKIYTYTTNLYNTKISAENSKNNRMTYPEQNPTPFQDYSNIPATAFKGHLLVKPQLQKIELPAALKNLEGSIYKVRLFDKTKGNKVPVFLRYSNFKNAETFQEVKDYKQLTIYSKSGEEIGSVNLDFSEWQSTTHLPNNHIRMHDLKNNKKAQYAGIGKTLVQAAVEQSLKKGGKGRIYVHACNIYNKDNDPFIFYNKMGLSVIDPRNNYGEITRYLKMLSEEETANLAKKLEGKNLETISPDEHMLAVYEAIAESRGCGLDEIYLNFSENMFLPDKHVKKIWIPKIKANPIFNPKNKIN